MQTTESKEKRNCLTDTVDICYHGIYSRVLPLPFNPTITGQFI